MKKSLNIISVLSFAILASCAGPQFRTVIEHEQLDLLAEESFMRYNSRRLGQKENSKDHFISQSLVACHQEKFTKGMEILEKQMHSNKTNPLYWNALGTCYYLKKDTAKALFYYQIGLEASQNLSAKNKVLANNYSSIILNNLALIHLKNKRFTETFDTLSKSIELAPNYFTPQFNLAQLYIEFNQDNKALSLLKGIEAQNKKNDVDLYYSLALIYFRKNDMNQSYSYITKIHANYLNRADIVGLYAYNLMNRNKLDEAKTILERRTLAVEFDKRNEELLDQVKDKIKVAKENEAIRSAPPKS